MKKAVKKKNTKRAPKKVNHSWKFPPKKYHVMKIESYVLAGLTLLVFIFMLFQFEDIFLC